VRTGPKNKNKKPALALKKIIKKFTANQIFIKFFFCHNQIWQFSKEIDTHPTLFKWWRGNFGKTDGQPRNQPQGVGEMLLNFTC
jgi:hypothetical protein